MDGQPSVTQDVKRGEREKGETGKRWERDPDPTLLHVSQRAVRPQSKAELMWPWSVYPLGQQCSLYQTLQDAAPDVARQIHTGTSTP